MADLGDHRARRAAPACGRAQPAGQRRQQRRLARAVGAREEHPLAGGDGQVERPATPHPTLKHHAVEGDDPGLPPFAGGQRQGQRRIRPRALGHGDAGSPCADLPGSARHLLGPGGHPLPAVLVVVASAPASLPRARRGTAARLALGPGEPLPGGQRVVVRGDRVGLRRLAGALVGVPAARVRRRRPGAPVEFQDPVADAAKQRAVVRDQHDPSAVSLDDGLEPAQPVGVQIVGRLVQEQHVAAGDRQGGEPRSRRLAAGHGAQRPVQHVVAEAESLGRAGRPPRARPRGQPPGSPRASRSRRPRRCLPCPDAGAGTRPAWRVARCLRGRFAGEDPQEGRLTGPVGPRSMRLAAPTCRSTSDRTVWSPWWKPMARASSSDADMVVPFAMRTGTVQEHRQGPDVESGQAVSERHAWEAPEGHASR